MSAARPYPFEVWPKATRAQARAAAPRRALVAHLTPLLEALAARLAPGEALRWGAPQGAGPTSRAQLDSSQAGPGGHVVALVTTLSAGPPDLLVGLDATLSAALLATSLGVSLAEVMARPLSELELALLDAAWLDALAALDRPEAAPLRLTHSGQSLATMLRVLRRDEALYTVTLPLRWTQDDASRAGAITAFVPRRGEMTRGARHRGPRGVLPDWTLALIDARVLVGWLTLSTRASAALVRGDVLFPSTPARVEAGDPARLRLCWLAIAPGVRLPCRLEGAPGAPWRLGLEAPGAGPRPARLSSPAEEPTMSDDHARDPTPPQPAASGDAITALRRALAQAPVEVALELGRARMSAAALAALEAGDLIALDAAVGDPVTLRVAGSVVGEGELVDLDGRVGVRVLRLHAARGD